ncbi:MAG: DUF4827 domain-containing protein [Bacteroidales bacterium]|nr:DUF4827 domain-containing protein [Bacteroidales bacterium]
MRKTVLFILTAMIAGIFLVACENQKTAQEYIREERKAIERFITTKNIKVLNNYPANHNFGANEFYRTNEGLYIQVVDSGNGTRVRPLIDRVQVRFNYLIDVKSYVTGAKDSVVPPESILPMQFIYGVPGSYGQPDVLYNFSCDGWAIPLQYIYEEAIINLIVPSSLGTKNDNQYFVARYYHNLKYTKFY